MPVPKGLITVIREWLVKADNDLKAAVHTLALGRDCPTDTVCFHAQQCVEKHIKALLVFRATPFPKTHNIHVLRALLPPKLRPKLDKKVQERLTEYAATVRERCGQPLPYGRGSVFWLFISRSASRRSSSSCSRCTHGSEAASAAV